MTAESGSVLLAFSSNEVHIGTSGTRLSRGRSHALVAVAEDVDRGMFDSTAESKSQNLWSVTGLSVLYRGFEQAICFHFRLGTHVFALSFNSFVKMKSTIASALF